MQEKLLKAEDLARMFDLSTQRVYDLVRQGIFPHCRVGRLIRFDPQRIEEFIASGGSQYGDHSK